MDGKIRDTEEILREIRFYQAQGRVLEEILKRKDVTATVSFQSTGINQALYSVTTMKGHPSLRRLVRGEVQMCRDAVRKRRKELAEMVATGGDAEW